MTFVVRAMSRLSQVIGEKEPPPLVIQPAAIPPIELPAVKPTARPAPDRSAIEGANVFQLASEVKAHRDWRSLVASAPQPAPPAIEGRIELQGIIRGKTNDAIVNGETVATGGKLTIDGHE